MIPLLGTFGTTLVIIALFRMNHGAFKVTNAVWAPYVWLLIASSRPLSNWLSLSEPVGQATDYADRRKPTRPERAHGANGDWVVFSVEAEEANVIDIIQELQRSSYYISRIA